MIYFLILGKECRKNLLSYLKLAPSNLAQLKDFVKKTEMLEFGTKNTLFAYF